MTTNETKLRTVVAQILGIPLETVSDMTSKDTIESWDSLKHLTLVLALEEQFDVSFNEEIAMEIMSIPQIRAALVDCGVAF